MVVGPSLARVSASAGLLALLTSAGCQAFFGVDDYDATPEDPPANASSGAGHPGAGGATSASDGPSATSGAAGGGGGAIDPTCVCLDGASPGWSGPFTVYTTEAPALPIEACSDGPLHAAYFNGPPGPAVCKPCTCSQPAVQCSGPTLLCYNATSCTGTQQDWTAQVSGVSCYSYPEEDLSCRVQGGGSATVGSCAPAGGEKTVSSWTTTHAVCNAPSAPEGCAEGTCYLKPAGARVCIVHDGPLVACPAGDWTQFKAYSGQDDQRTCSSCSCGSATGAACGSGTYTFYTDPNCFLAPLNAKTACQQMSPNGSAGESVHYSPGQVVQPGSCPASGGLPGGTFTGTGDVTLCCRG